MFTLNFQTKFGNPAPKTQKVQYTETGELQFISYGTVIVQVKNGEVTLDETYWNHSNTTGFYRNQFLNETINETRAKLKHTEYKLGNLN